MYDFSFQMKALHIFKIFDYYYLATALKKNLDHYHYGAKYYITADVL